MEYKYLVMVTTNNNNKYYEMIPNGDSFTVKYGRIGASAQVASYSASQFDKKYNEKIKKGYVDQTELRKDLIKIEKKEKKDKYLPIAEETTKRLIDFLQEVARQKIAENYTVSSESVTQAMINEAQTVLNKIANEKDKEEFNKKLLTLFNILPRKMYDVNAFLAKSGDKEEFSKIYIREQELLNVMRGQVVQHTIDEQINEDVEEPQQTILEALGLEIEPINEIDERIILKELGEIKDKFYMGWKVKNIKTSNKFEEHLKTSIHKNKKLLWHGSRNENWMSIISNGLILNPNAVITGKMFGQGIYFAPKSRKSFGYTSYDGSYWARGNSKRAFMGLYEVHYGNPYIVSDFSSRFYDYNFDKLKQNGNYDCLHADSTKGMLRNDEIVVYREDQVNIKYLVELR